jgi:3-deoxy-7-phosphoheptulonate synthase
MLPSATLAEIGGAIKAVEAQGFKAHTAKMEGCTAIGIVGETQQLGPEIFQALPGVDRVMPVAQPYKMAGRAFKPSDTIVRVGHIRIGEGTFTAMAGPCAVESREQVFAAAAAVKKAGASVLRGGAFKPRTSPYAFQGLGEEGLKILAEAREATGLAVITEVMSPTEVDLVNRYADILQIGARNVQNFRLLEACGKQDKPVLLKRGMMTTIEELLLSAEYIMSCGNPNVLLCERGIRTFERAYRNTLDITAVPVIKKLSHLPIVIDPSHAAGIRELVAPLARAAVAVGADGMLVETHPQPDQALCDGAQSLTLEQFAALMDQIRPLVRDMGKTLAS